MPKHIKILPSGRSFPCEGNSTLLEAGLHAGLALGYGCSNGNCGECLARIISGKVHKVHHHDYVISEVKRLSGHVLMCCNTAVTDVVLEAPEAQNSRQIPHQQITAKVRNIGFINDDVALLHLKTPRSQRLRFLAGQYVQLRIGETATAAHAISSCPCDDMNLHFQIPRLAEDEFSHYLFEQLKKADAVDIEGPMGDFVLNENSSRPLVFIACHTGFAPVRSLIEHAMALEIADSMRLVWVTRSKSDRYQDNLCRSWRDAFDIFTYLPLDTGPDDGKFDIPSILRLLNIEPGDIENYDFYVAGNKRFISKFERMPGWNLMITPPALENSREDF